MNCKHCNEPIHETGYDDCPFVHDFGGCAFCDVHSLADVFDHRRMIPRTTAEPDECEEFTGANLSWYLFSSN